MSVWCRGIRGATTCEANTAEAILTATREMIALLVQANAIDPHTIAAAIFTTTPDLNAAYPAVAARALGWTDTALLCGHEMNVPDGLPRCIRVLVLWNTERSADQLVHIYLHGARNLRPDLSAALAAFKSVV